MSQLLSKLKEEKIPYFLGALFAIIALQFNYTINYILKLPILEYKFEDRLTIGDSLYEKKLVLKNLSLEKSIKNFHIQLVYKKMSKSRIKDPKIDPVPPATIIQNDPKYIDEKLAYFPIKIIQPEMAYELSFITNEKYHNPIFFFDCEDSIRMQEKSLLTFFIKNQIIVNFLLMLCFILLSIIYIINIR